MLLGPLFATLIAGPFWTDLRQSQYDWLSESGCSSVLDQPDVWREGRQTNAPLELRVIPEIEVRIWIGRGHQRRVAHSLLRGQRRFGLAISLALVWPLGGPERPRYDVLTGEREGDLCR